MHSLLPTAITESFFTVFHKVWLSSRLNTQELLQFYLKKWNEHPNGHIGLQEMHLNNILVSEILQASE